MTWAEPWWLIGLIVPVVILFFQLKGRLEQRGGLPPGLRRTDGGQGGAAPAPRRSIYGAVALACVLLALARPQYGFIELPVFQQARQVVIALDVSKSMLADDIPPSRLDRSRLLIYSLLDELGSEQVGLLLFSGTAFLQCPLSSDYEIIEEMLPEVGPDYLPRGGTDYRAMLRTALEAFDTNGVADRFLIVFSDGESLQPGWEVEAEKLKAEGIQVIGLGVGTREGGLVPEPDGGFVKDPSGAAVLSKLESKTLESLATLTGGRYVEASQWVDLNQLIQQTVEQGRAGEFQEKSERVPIERYQFPLACAVFFALMRLWREIPVQPRQVQTLPKARKGERDVETGKPEREPVRVGAGASAGEVEAVRKPVVPPPLPKGYLLLLLLVTMPVSAQSPGTEPPSGPLADLRAAVGELAVRPVLSAPDYARLARTTIQAGQPPQGGGQPVPLPRGSIEDGLDAVERGRALDPGAAEWDELEAALRQMLEPPEPPPSQQNQENQQKGEKGEKGENQKNNENPSESEPSESGDEGQPSDSAGEQQNTEGQPQDGEPGEGEDQESDQAGNESGQEGDEGQPSDPNSSQGGNPPEPFDPQEMMDDPNAGLGDLGEEEAQPEPATPQDPGDQQVVQGTSSAQEISEELASDESLRRLMARAEQLRNRDKPGVLYQRMQGDPDQPPQEGKDW